MGAAATQAITSPLRQVENANDIGQMVGALFAGMTNRILNASTGGLASIGTNIGGQPSYLSQVNAEAATGLNQAVTNVALAILGPALTVEQQYNQTESAIATNLTQAIGLLKTREATCWQFIQQNTCVGSTTISASGATCTGAGGGTLHVATSTQFSQPIINSQIAPLATAIENNLTASQQAIAAINQLIASVANSASPAVQQSALNQLDTLVAQGTLHTQSDVNTAAQNLTDTQTATSQLLQTTTDLWTGTDSSGNLNQVAWDGSSSAGWCNVPVSPPANSAQQTTINLWTQKWQ